MKNACSRWSFLAVPVLAALGCSDPVPLPAQGAISLQIGGPSSTCPEPGNVYPVGKLKNDPTDPTGMRKIAQAPSDSDPGQSVVDGESGTTVSCSVRGKGPFTFSGSLHATSNDEAKDPITVTFSNGVVNDDKKTGTVMIGVFTPQLDGQFSSGSVPCTVNVINQQIKGGSIWADFSCPNLTSPPSGVCTSGVAPSVSTFVFENCDGS
ncbi:MAG TPA: hypothetical protein VHW01_00210 [Polyangiaceae bacterium]|jgi:hypothetical protein|nr:hypothetical protein [Polyangiaceae bacterium]